MPIGDRPSSPPRRPEPVAQGQRVRPEGVRPRPRSGLWYILPMEPKPLPTKPILTDTEIAASLESFACSPLTPEGRQPEYAPPPWNADAMYDSGDTIGRLALDRGRGVRVIKSGDDTDIAYLAHWRQDDTELTANAKLIAAAPIMYRTLRFLSTYMADGHTEVDFNRVVPGPAEPKVTLGDWIRAATTLACPE